MKCLRATSSSPNQYLYYIGQYMMELTGGIPAPGQRTAPVQVGRLSVGSYEQLEKEVVNPYCDNETTPIAAGYKLGVQAVLKKLREGFVIQ